MSQHNKTRSVGSVGKKAGEVESASLASPSGPTFYRREQHRERRRRAEEGFEPGSDSDRGSQSLRPHYLVPQPLSVPNRRVLEGGL